MDASAAALSLPRGTLRTHQVALVAALLLLAYAIPIAVPRVVPDWFPTAAGDNKCYKYSASDKGFHQKMNGERSKRGFGTMKLDPELSKAAMVHTVNEMAKVNTLQHTTTTNLKKRVTGWVELGENVGVGSTVDSLHTAFMNSTAHKANILHKSFNNVGVGSTTSGGRLWVTVIFESKSNPGTPLAMPKC